MRPTVACSKRSVAYSVSTRSPPSSSSYRSNARSKRAVSYSTCSGAISIPARRSASARVFCSISETWNSGLRLRSRGMRSSSTMRSKGRSWWSNAASVAAFSRRRSARKVSSARTGPAQRQRVDEEADQPLHLRARAPRHRRADDHVLLSATSAPARRAAPPAARRRASSPPPRQRAEPPCQRRRHRGRARRARGGAPRAGAAVRRQLQRGRGAGQRAAPERPLLLQRLPGQVLPLPERVVRVLHGERAAADRARRPGTRRTARPARAP